MSHVQYVNDVTFENSKVTMAIAGVELSEDQLRIGCCDNRLILVSGGEQAGKSLTAAAYLFLRMFFGKLFWLVGDDYEQCQPEFRYVTDWLGKVGAVQEKNLSMPQRGAWQAKVEGGITIKTKTADDIRKLAREAPDGIIMCEAAQMGYDVYKKLLGRTAPKKAWMMLVGTLEAATDWYAQFYNRWQVANTDGGASFCLPSWANKYLYPLGRQDPEIIRLEKMLDPELFMMRFGAKPYPPETLIFRSFDFATHVPGDVFFDKKFPTQLWIDPGFSGSHYAVEVVQIVEPDKHCDSQHIHVIDELYLLNTSTPEIIEICTHKDWWTTVEYVIMDIAGTQRTAIGQSVAEQWSAEGLPIMAEHIGIEDGIGRHRVYLKDPGTGQARIFFNEGCVAVFGEYGRWKRRKVIEGVNQTSKPEVTNCDALKAINYGLVANFGYADREQGTVRVVNPFSE